MKNVSLQQLIFSHVLLIIILIATMMMGSRMRALSDLKIQHSTRNSQPTTSGTSAQNLRVENHKPMTATERKALRNRHRNLVNNQPVKPQTPTDTPIKQPPVNQVPQPQTTPTTTTTTTTPPPRTKPSDIIIDEQPLGYFDQCSNRLLELMSFENNNQGLIGKPDHLGEFYGLYDVATARAVSNEVTLLTRFIDIFNLEKKYDEKEFQHQNTEKTTIATTQSPQTTASVEVVKNSEQFDITKALLTGMILEKTELIFNFGNEVRIIPRKDIETKIQLRNIDQKLYPSPFELINKAVRHIESSTKNLFFVTDKSIYRQNRSTKKIRSLPLPLDHIKPNKYLFKYYRGNFHFLTKHSILRYDLKNHRWQQFPLLLNISASSGINMIDYAVEYRAERFFYWVSTQYRGILVFNEKGGMLGSQLEIPLGTKKVNLGNHPASMVRNIGGDIFFAVNAKEDSNTEAFILFYSKKDKGWKKLPNPQKEIYYYQYMEKHGPWLTLIYDTGEKTGVSLLDLSKIQQGTARYPFNIKADELFVKGTADQKNLYLADLEGNVIRYNLGDNGEKGSEKGNE